MTAIALAGCASPEQRCIDRAQQDLNTVSRLIAETEANLARGYRYVTEPAPTFGYGFCTGSYNIRFCSSNYTNTRRVPVAIEPDEELAKLEGLRTKQQELSARSAQNAAACQAIS
ncbi:MAG: hypothetical protein AAF667_07300 [Pseudomonadota bacterium]